MIRTGWARVSLLLPVFAASAGLTRAQGNGTLSPALRLHLPQPEIAIATASPGVKLEQTYTGNVGIAAWQVSTPAVLADATPGCAFSLPIPRLPTGAFVLAGSVAQGTINHLQVDTFGTLSEPRAFASIQRITATLRKAKWQPAPNVLQLSAKQVHSMLPGATGLAVSTLTCGHRQLLLSIDRDPRHATAFSYSLTYEVLP